MKYTIAFSFVTNDSTNPMNASLQITDANTISFDGGPAQIQPYGTISTPPMTYLSVAQNGINFLAGANPGAATQALQVIVAVNAVGSGMMVNLSYSNVIVDVFYQFIGYSNSASLAVGNNMIPFPD